MTSTASCEYGLFPIATKMLRETAPPDLNVYLKQAANGRPTLFHKRGTPFDLTAIEALVANDVNTLYVSSEEIETYSDYLLDVFLEDEDRPPVERFGMLRDASKSLVLEAMVAGGAEEVVNVTRELAERLVNVIWDRQVVLMDLFDVMAHDYTTFTHASNVSTYCLLIADKLGITSQADLVSIGQGGLLHDLGKRKIPKALLKKKAQLTDDEWKEMKKHPSYGFEELSCQPDIDWGQLMMVYQHHERCDGKGYPVGIPAEEIHPWAKICSVVDAFDALTTDRAYRRAYITDNAVSFLESQAGKSFDSEIVRCLTTILKQSN